MILVLAVVLYLLVSGLVLVAICKAGGRNE
jgi:hypothetical protein